jgi:hypothetical protein
MKGPVLLQLLPHPLQFPIRHEQQRLGAQGRQVALVKNIGEQIGLRLQPRGQPLHELPVALHVLAFHHHRQFVLARKLLAELHVNLVRLLVRPDHVVLVHVEVQKEGGIDDANGETGPIAAAQTTRGWWHTTRATARRDRAKTVSASHRVQAALRCWRGSEFTFPLHNPYGIPRNDLAPTEGIQAPARDRARAQSGNSALE